MCTCYPLRYFPALEVIRGSMIVEHCNIIAFHGTAVMVGQERVPWDSNDADAKIHLRNCSIASPLLCIVAKWKATATMRDCEFREYM